MRIRVVCGRSEGCNSKAALGWADNCLVPLHTAFREVPTFTPHALPQRLLLVRKAREAQAGFTRSWPVSQICCSALDRGYLLSSFWEKGSAKKVPTLVVQRSVAAEYNSIRNHKITSMLSSRFSQTAGCSFCLQSNILSFSPLTSPGVQVRSCQSARDSLLQELCQRPASSPPAESSRHCWCSSLAYSLGLLWESQERLHYSAS